MNSQIILLHSISHIVTALYFYKKDGISICSFLWIYLSIFSVGGVVLLNSRLYFYVMDYPHFTESTRISYLPYVFNYIFTFILIYPFRYVKSNRLNSDVIVSSTSCSLVRICIFVEYLYIFIKISQLVTVIRYGFGYFHELGHLRQDAILYSSMPFLRYINYIGKFVNIVIFPYILVHHFLLYLKKIIPSKDVLKIGYIYSLSSVLVGLVSGSRATIFFGVLNVLFFIVFFWIYIPKKYKNNSILFFMLGIYIMYNLFFAIASERFSGRMSASDNVLRYWGESYLNLGFEVWNNLQMHTNGLVTFHEIYQLDSNDTSLLTGINTWWFTTIYGGLFMDFGPYIPIFLAFVIAVLFSVYIKRKTPLAPNKIVVILYYFQICYMMQFNLFISTFDIVILGCMLLLPRFMDRYFIGKNF